MANEYNELEQLVNDVTNIDTARMTLRWALERLNSIEKEKAELKKNLTITEDTRKGLELKVQSLEDTFKSRGKSLEEKEGFYNKLEATMSLLGDGKLDIQQLLKKEAKLDHLRLELENEYQDKFEELDKNQSSVIERWNTRLLDVEGQYAKRLSEAQVRYDSLRAELEADYQARLGTLNSSFQHKEKELMGRIQSLETSVKAGGDTLEGRRKELETEFMAKKDELEANYHKLKNTLEIGFQGRVHSMENDHCAQIKSLERTWNAERERLMAEQHARDEQFESSQMEMARLEGQLYEQQEKHHAELLDIITKKEDAFRVKVESLEKEKAAYEETVRKLEEALSFSWDEHHGELIDRIRNSEETFKARLEQFEAEKEEYKTVIAGLVDEAGAKDEYLMEEKKRLQEEFKQKYASFEAELAARAAKAAEEKAAAAANAEAQLKEKVASASAKATQLMKEQLHFMEIEVNRVEQYTKDERRVMEDTFNKERERLADELARKNNYIEVVDHKLQEMEDDLMKTRQNSAVNSLSQIADQDDKVKALVEQYEAQQDKIEMETAERVEEIRATAEARLAENNRVKELELAEARISIKKLEEALAVSADAHHSELMARIRSGEEAFRAKAAEFEAEKQKKLHFMEGELSRLEKQAKDERRIMEENFNKERERLAEELGRKNNYIEVVDCKLQEMENELMTTRQNSAVNSLSQIVDQDDRVKALVEEYRARQDQLEIETAERVGEIRAAAEARLKEMEEMLKAKEKLLRGGGDFWRQKEAEFDAQSAELNLRMHQINEELFARKQEFSSKENQLNEFRLNLERDNAARMAEIEKLKFELTRAIMDYKNRK